MEEVLSLIFHGCKLVKDLETNLPNLANQPSNLGNSCDEIVRVFSDTRERLNALICGQQMMHRDDQLQHQESTAGQMDQIAGGDGVMQEWLRFSQAMDMVVRHASQQVQHHRLPERSRVAMEPGEVEPLEVINARELDAGDAAVQPMDHVGDQSGGGSATLQGSRRRYAILSRNPLLHNTHYLHAKLEHHHELSIFTARWEFKIHYKL